jgi:hypothetical protein
LTNASDDNEAQEITLILEGLNQELSDVNREISNAKGELTRAAADQKAANEKRAETEAIA